MPDDLPLLPRCCLCDGAQLPGVSHARMAGARPLLQQVVIVAIRVFNLKQLLLQPAGGARSDCDLTAACANPQVSKACWGRG